MVAEYTARSVASAVHLIAVSLVGKFAPEHVPL